MLHYFNPGHETAVLNASPYYKPPAIQLKMREDLSYLSAWYASADDFVWVEKKLPEDFSAMLGENFGPMPQAVGKYNVDRHTTELSGMPVRLWGISPQSIHFFEQVNRESHLNLQIPVWKDDYRKLGSRPSAKTCLEYVVTLSTEISSEIIPDYYSSLEDIQKEIDSNPGSYLIKSPYSSSGRGLLWLSDGVINQSGKQILQGMLKKQSTVSLEKVLDKKVDFSLQFSSDGKGNIVFEGLSIFQTDAKGNYRGTFVGSQQNIQTQISAYYQPEKLENIKELLITYLAKNYASVYQGEIGVDMMIYEDGGRYCLHPCVEINMRTTMGFLSLRLNERLANEHISGNFSLDFSNKPEEIYSKHLEYSKKYPLACKKGKIQSGYLPLCPVTKESNYHAYILIT